MALSFVQMSLTFFLRRKASLDISQFQGLHNKMELQKEMNRTILEKVCCMISHSNLVKEFWAEAASTTCYLINRLPNRALDGCILEEV